MTQKQRLSDTRDSAIPETEEMVGRGLIGVSRAAIAIWLASTGCGIIVSNQSTSVEGDESWE